MHFEQTNMIKERTLTGDSNKPPTVKCKYWLNVHKSYSFLFMDKKMKIVE